MPKSELKSSASEDENNVTEENEISDDEYLSDFTKLQPYEYKPCFGRAQNKTDQEKNHQIQKLGNTLGYSCGKSKPMATHPESI